jgi:hypothetical protein
MMCENHEICLVLMISYVKVVKKLINFKHFNTYAV